MYLESLWTGKIPSCLICMVCARREVGIGVPVACAAKSFRTPEPRFSIAEFPWRTAYGRFDVSQTQKIWQKFQNAVNMSDLPNPHALIGRTVPVLISLFHKDPEPSLHVNKKLEVLSVCAFDINGSLPSFCRGLSAQSFFRSSAKLRSLRMESAAPVEHCSSLAHTSVYHISIYKPATSLYTVTFQAVVRLKSGIQEAETAVAEDRGWKNHARVTAICGKCLKMW